MSTHRGCALLLIKFIFQLVQRQLTEFILHRCVANALNVYAAHPRRYTLDVKFYQFQITSKILYNIILLY